MCSECLQTPCHPRCPNYDPPVWGECDCCGSEIYDGDYYYEIDGNIYCNRCIKESKMIAEVDYERN